MVEIETFADLCIRLGQIPDGIRPSDIREVRSKFDDDANLIGTLVVFIDRSKVWADRDGAVSGSSAPA